VSNDDLPIHEQVDALRRAGDMAGARARVKSALGELTGEERGRLLVALARVNLDSGENTAAVASLEEAHKLLAEIRQPSELGELLLDLGRAKRRLGGLQDALRVLEEATDQFSAARDSAGRRRALAARGKVLYAMHDWKGARGAFRAGLEHKGEDPPNWRLHHAMARAYEKDGRVGEAEEAYARAKQAGWDGVGRVRPYQSEEGTAASDLTVSRADVLVDHDDEAELKRSAGKLERKDLLKLVSLTGALNSALAPEPLLELLLDRAIQWSGAEQGYVVLCRPVRGEEPRVEVRVSRDSGGQKVEKPEDEVSRNIVRETVEKGAPVVSDNAMGDVRLAEIKSVADRGLRSVACLPLRVRSGPALGALYVESRTRAGAFGEREQILLEALANHVALAFERSTRYQRLAEAYNETRRALEERTGQMFGLIGKARSMRQVFRMIEKLRNHDAPVLIEGETGTGKELIARAIHRSSRRRNHPLITVNCAALPPALIESELFGHERGAFTGADTRRVGRFEVADGGTLFLDEIGELPLDLQVKLLRVLQEGEFQRLGSSHTIKTDVRIITATNRDLQAAVRDGQWREDLWYRLNVFPVTVPPLRDRKEDIEALTKFFVERFAGKTGRTISSIHGSALDALRDYDWPGNVRELENVIERAVITSSGPRLLLADRLVAGSTPGADGDHLNRTLEEVERDHITRILVSHKWRVEGDEGAAKVLGLNPSTLRGKMRRLGIARGQGRHI